MERGHCAALADEAPQSRSSTCRRTKLATSSESHSAKPAGRATFIDCDVRRENQVPHSIEQTRERIRRLHIVVNCAGIVQVKQLHRARRRRL
jgi:NAD(P)-dependent dehydrogenase (short-subunit alcohol dehydrogenase family)